MGAICLANWDDCRPRYLGVDALSRSLRTTVNSPDSKPMNFLAGSDGPDGPENIWIACSDGEIGRVTELLQRGQDVNAQDENGYSPIHAAVSYGHMQLVELLLSAGANVNIKDIDGDTPLHICEKPEVAEYLIMNGADTSALNNHGQSVYEQAVELENDEMIQFWAKRFGITVSFKEEEHSHLEGVPEEVIDTADSANTENSN